MKVDWPEIARRLGEGDSARSLAREFGISHTAVLKRARREGWRRRGANGKPAEPRLPATRPAPDGVLALGNRTEENMRILLAKVASGAKQTTAARSLGISHPALGDWKKADPTFAALLDAAEAEQHIRDEEAIVDARKRGDWKAGLTRLERGKNTRDDWAAPERASGGSGGITVVFNWSRDEPPKQPTVDVTPARREIEAEVSAAG